MKAKIKPLTHVIAVGIAAIAGFLVTPAGQALIRQYPVLVPVATGIGVIAALYRTPRQTSNAN